MAWNGTDQIVFKTGKNNYTISLRQIGDWFRKLRAKAKRGTVKNAAENIQQMFNRDVLQREDNTHPTKGLLVVATMDRVGHARHRKWSRQVRWYVNQWSSYK